MAIYMKQRKWSTTWAYDLEVNLPIGASKEEAIDALLDMNGDLSSSDRLSLLYWMEDVEELDAVWVNIVDGSEIQDIAGLCGPVTPKEGTTKKVYRVKIIDPIIEVLAENEEEAKIRALEELTQVEYISTTEYDAIESVEEIDINQATNPSEMERLLQKESN